MGAFVEVAANRYFLACFLSLTLMSLILALTLLATFFGSGA